MRKLSRLQCRCGSCEVSRVAITVFEFCVKFIYQVQQSRRFAFSTNLEVYTMIPPNSLVLKFSGSLSSKFFPRSILVLIHTHNRNRIVILLAISTAMGNRNTLRNKLVTQRIGAGLRRRKILG